MKATTRVLARRLPGLAALLLLFFSFSVTAQDEADFYDLDAADELHDISQQIENDDVDTDGLNAASERVGILQSQATACASEAAATHARLQERFEPLKDLDPEEASTESLAQRQSIRSQLDEAIALEARCEGIADDAEQLQARITERRNLLSQQFLSSRGDSAWNLIRHFPERASGWSEVLGTQLALEFAPDISQSDFGWALFAAMLVGVAGGLLARRRFSSWYEAGGGDEASPQLKYLFPKPLAECAPLWLTGAALFIAMTVTLAEPSTSLAVVRIAIAMFGLGMSCVVISWATGPLSPSVDINGLIPDHVQPLRRRMQLLALAVAVSYVVLGNEWLSTRATQPYVAGRASMTFIVALGTLGVLMYLRQVPGIRNRYRPLRMFATFATLVAIVALLLGYQNLAGYLVQGVTRSGLALFLLWITLWLVFRGFSYLLDQDSTTAGRVRISLGMSRKGSSTGVGFMQLVVDLFLWLGTIAYLISVWDNTGATLSRLQRALTDGWDFGGVSIVPRSIVVGILVFAVLMVVMGWVKRWIDRRWLQRIVIDRGARDAILTLYSYVAFVLAVLIALKAANVDLTGLAIISGALALGLGFGLQSIANNFVSGLILLFERPIRAGDFVSVGETEGYVRRIRIRATEIETLDNQNVLVPNSELVSGRVTNWVLRDTHGRLQVRVGVAYGSDTERVREILERIGTAHPEVITDGRAPAPRALFMGFGDSALDFELRVRVQRIERRFSVMSDLNFEIDKAFREAGITIPFPQRDLHIVSYPSGEEPTSVTEKKRRTSSAQPDEVTRSHSAELTTARSREEVWQALIDIDSLKRWFARDGFFEAQIGGRYELSTRDGYEVTGRVDVFVPRRRLRVIVLSDEALELATGPITIEVSLEDIDDKTHLTVTVAGIPGTEDWEEYYRLSVDRWRHALAELKSDVLRK